MASVNHNLLTAVVFAAVRLGHFQDSPPLSACSQTQRIWAEEAATRLLVQLIPSDLCHDQGSITSTTSVV